MLGRSRSGLSRRKVLTRTFLVGSAAGATYLATTSQQESVAGLRREALFWSRVGPVIADYYFQTASSSPWVKYQEWRGLVRKPRNQVLEELHQRHAPTIYQTLLDLKGLYIKLGQVLSVTALPIPEPYRVLFRNLQSDVPGWQDFSVIQPVLEREFGNHLESVLQVDPVPCGAASIGQAHRATLLSSNEQVIVKVQYPNAAWQVPADIQCVGDFMQVCVWFGVLDESAAKLSFEEFARQFLAELDYQQEAANLQTVYESSLDPTAPYQKRNVVVPRVYPEYCSARVITMSYLPGPKLEAEARRQLALLGIDVSSRNGGIGKIVRDAAKDAADPAEPETGELVRRVTTRLKETRAVSWRDGTFRFVGNIMSVDTILWAVRSFQWLFLWSQAAAVSTLQVVPRSVLPAGLDDWVQVHQTAAAQAKRLNLTAEWIDALFDVHGHQIFNLGLFNADPHPGNILVVEDETTSNKLGLIDYGQCKRLTPREQVLVARLILSVAHAESDLAVATTLRDMKIGTKNDSTEFLAKFGRLMFGPLQPQHMDHSWHRALHEQDRVVYFPKELSMVYRTSLLLRGLALSLQVNASVSEQWKHHAQQTIERHPEIVQEIVQKKGAAPRRVDKEIVTTEPLPTVPAV